MDLEKISAEITLPKYLTIRILLYLLVGSICSFQLVRFLLPEPPLFPILSSPKIEEPEKLEIPNPIYNSTLGFQYIWATELPQRTDRKRILRSAANATGIEVVVFNGLTDDEVEEDERLPHFREDERVGDLACAVTHIRSWERMISKNITTALIIEGDADWDPRLKSLLTDFAAANLANWIPRTGRYHRPSNYIATESTRTNITHDSPYGDNWDLLWFGHCGIVSDFFHPYTDPTAPPRNREHELTGFKFGVPSFHDEDRKPHQRLIADVRKGVCAQAYGLSLRGARKLAAAAKEMDEMVDTWLGTKCGDGTLNCVAPWPQIFDDAKSASSSHGRDEEEKEKGRKRSIPKGEPNGPKWDSVLEYSMRVNADLIRAGGGMNEWVRNWDKPRGRKPSRLGPVEGIDEGVDEVEKKLELRDIEAPTT